MKTLIFAIALSASVFALNLGLSSASLPPHDGALSIRCYQESLTNLRSSDAATKTCQRVSEACYSDFRIHGSTIEASAGTCRNVATGCYELARKSRKSIYDSADSCRRD